MLSYPLQLKQESNRMPYLNFYIYKYVPLNFADINERNTTAENTLRKEPLESIRLYVPEGIANSFASNWGSTEVFGFSQALSGDAGAGQDVAGAFGAKLLSAMPESVKAEMQLGGASINPKEQQLFQGSDYFNIAFSFELVPESKEESQQIIRIIDWFDKMRKAISLNGDSYTYLLAPPICDISLVMPNGDIISDDTDYNLLKDANYMFLKNGTWTPMGGDGIQRFYADGSFIGWKIDIDFSSIYKLTNRNGMNLVSDFAVKQQQQANEQFGG